MQNRRSRSLRFVHFFSDLMYFLRMERPAGMISPLWQLHVSDAALPYTV